MLLGLASSCKNISEDAFSTDPVAPEFYAHNNILMTSNTMDEDVTFSWSEYRFMGTCLPYTVTMTYDNQTVTLGTTNDQFITMSKKDFKDKIYAAFPTLPVNSSFLMNFNVSVLFGEKKYESETMTLDIYAFGDAVAPVITTSLPELELLPEEGTVEFPLMDWTEARLTYGEDVSYNIYVGVINGDAEMIVQLAEGVSGLSYSVVVDDLNEAIISAGGAESAVNDVNFYVEAFCASISGIKSAPMSSKVTTYTVSFPEILYLPGSYQGWDPASAATLKVSSSRKGFYEGIIDLRTSDGGDVEFKFSPVPRWEGDFGGKVDVSAAGSDIPYSYAVGTVGVPDNIKVPSGVYDIALDKKLNKLQMVEVKQISMIGAACGDFGWGQDVDLVYDAEAGTFTAQTTLKAAEYKFRINHDWTFSIGSQMGITMSDGNLSCPVEGDYKVVLNTASCPYTVKFINTSFPDKVYVPGSHNGWSFDNSLAGDGEGHYEGYMNIGGEWGFKFTPKPEWGAEWGLDSSVPVTTDAKGGTVYGLTSTGGGNIMEGSDGSYHKVVVDLTQNTVTVYPVTEVGIIGGFDGWAADYASFKYDASSDSWKAEEVVITSSKTEWKFRMNQAWDINLGGDLADLTQDGPNITYEAGMYNIELFLGTIPYHAVLTKSGEVDPPALPNLMYMIGEAVGGWDWDSNAVEMIPVWGWEGGFYAIRYLETGKGFKFCPDKSWSGRDFYQLGDDSGYYEEGGNCYVEKSGLYMINVDYRGNRLVLEPARIYGMGDCFKGWDEGVEFTDVAKDGVVTSPILNTGELRLYTVSSVFDVDWWKMEFIILDGKIVYRGDGSDQDRVTCFDDMKVRLDFNAGTGEIWDTKFDW
jgi:hypothetical protein